MECDIVLNTFVCACRLNNFTWSSNFVVHLLRIIGWEGS